MTHLAIVDTNNTSDHFGHNDHVAQVCLDDGRFFIGRCLLLCFTEFLDKTHRAALETTLEATAGTGMDELIEIEKIDPSVFDVRLGALLRQTRRRR